MNHQIPSTTQSAYVSQFSIEFRLSVILTAVGQAESQIVGKWMSLKGQENGKVDDEGEEVSDIRMGRGDVTDVIPLHTLDPVVFALINLALFQVLLSCLSHVWHISRQSREERSVKD